MRLRLRMRMKMRDILLLKLRREPPSGHSPIRMSTTKRCLEIRERALIRRRVRKEHFRTTRPGQIPVRHAFNVVEFDFLWSLRILWFIRAFLLPLSSSSTGSTLVSAGSRYLASIAVGGLCYNTFPRTGCPASSASPRPLLFCIVIGEWLI